MNHDNIPWDVRVSLADLPAHRERGDAAWVAGRVVQASASRRCFQLADSSGAVLVQVVQGEVPAAGAIIAALLQLDEQLPVSQRWELLTPCRSRDPFPSPGGEYFRLNDAGPMGRTRAALLAFRSCCLAALRGFFEERGYVEVQPPHLVVSPGLEPHLVALPGGSGEHLITSPEYHMKRLLCAGLERIYSLGPCWRGDEHGPLHLREFCMLEWYRAYEDLDGLMAETEALLAQVARRVLGGTGVTRAGRALELAAPFHRVTVRDALLRHAGVDVKGVLDPGELRRLAEAAGHGPLAADAPFEEVVSRLWVDRVQPALAAQGPVFVHDFPAPLAALSRLRPSDPTVAERFELYIAGVELANAFGELTDPDEQERRLQADQEQRRVAGAAVYPLDRRFLAALREGMPPAAGIALGVDRLVMLLAGEAHIARVAAFAPDEV